MTVYIKRSGEIRVSEGAPQDGEMAVPNPLGLIRSNERKPNIGFGKEWIAISDFVFDPESRIDLVRENAEELCWWLFACFESFARPQGQQGSRGYSEASGVWN